MKRNQVIGIVWLLVAAWSSTMAMAEPEAAQSMSFYDFEMTNIAGDALPLSEYRGKVVLLVNTASLCGFTKQYAGLQSVYEQFADRGFVVLGAPSNDFGGQEPGANEDIKTFCEVNFNVRFPLTEKISVSGPNAHPVYNWAANVLGDEARPKWNFHKILIDGDGKPIAAYPSSTRPESATVINAIEAALSR